MKKTADKESREKLTTHLKSQIDKYIKFDSTPDNEDGWYEVKREDVYKIIDGIIPMIKSMVKTTAFQPQSQPKGETLYKKVIKEAIFLLSKSQPDNCPKWMEGFGDCNTIGCEFCRIQKCIDSLEELPPSHSIEPPPHTQSVKIREEVDKKFEEADKLLMDLRVKNLQLEKNLYDIQAILFQIQDMMVVTPAAGINKEEIVKWLDNEIKKTPFEESEEKGEWLGEAHQALKVVRDKILSLPTQSAKSGETWEDVIHRYRLSKDYQHSGRDHYKNFINWLKKESPLFPQSGLNKEEIVKWLDGEIDTNPDEIGRSMNSTIRRVKRFILSLPTPEKESKKD